MPKKKPIKPRGKQHDIRSASLARLADDCDKRSHEIAMSSEFSTERILTLSEMANIFRNAAKRERKLR